MSNGKPSISDSAWGTYSKPPPQTPEERQRAAQTESTQAGTTRTRGLTPSEVRKAEADARKAELDLAEAEAKAAEREAKTAEAGEAESSVLAGLARTIAAAAAAKGKSRDEWFATGFGAETARDLGATEAANVAGLLKTIGSKTAIDTLVELKAAGTALTPVSNTDIELMRTSLADLSQSQTDEEFQRSMNVVMDAFLPIYKRLGGTPDLLQTSYEMRTGQPLPADAIPGFQTLKPAEEKQPGLAVMPEFKPEQGVQVSAPMPGRTSAPEYEAASEKDRLAVQKADEAIWGQLQQAFDGGASRPELNRLAKELGRAPLDQQQLIEAIRYRDNYYKQGGRGPSGAGFNPPMTEMSPEQRKAVTSLNSASAATGRSLGNALSFGLAPDITGAVAGPEAEAAQRFSLAYSRNASPWASFAGDFLGAIAPTVVAAKGLSLAGMAAPRAALLSDIAYGGIRGTGENPEDRAFGALTGTATAAGGNIAATQLLAPAAQRLLAKYLPPKPTYAQQTIAEGKIGDIGAAEQQLREAIDLELPYGFADTSTKAQQLSRQAGRRSEATARQIDVGYGERASARPERASVAIERDIAPPVDPTARVDEIEEAADAAAGPLYDRAILGRAAPVDPKLDDMLNTTLGQQGLRRAYQYAEAKGVDPRGLGFDLDPQGNVVLVQKPSWETLHYIRKGLSRKINEFRDPVTRTLDTRNPDVQDYTNFLRRYDRRLDVLNPDYAAARAEWARYIKPRDFLEQGLKMADPNVRPAEIQRALTDIARMPAGTPEERMIQQQALQAFREGYATRLNDIVSNTRQAGGDPYANIAGTPRLRQKLELVAADPVTFMRQFEAERAMEQTRRATAVAPAQQARAEGEALLTGADLAGAVAETALSGAPALSAANLARNAAGSPGVRSWVADKLRLGAPWRAQKRADELGPILTGTDPEEALRALQEAGQVFGAYQQGVAPIRARIGLAGGAAAPAASDLFGGRDLNYTPEPKRLDPQLLVAGAYGTGARLNEDGSVTRPDGVVVDAATVKDDLLNTAQSISRYY